MRGAFTLAEAKQLFRLAANYIDETLVQDGKRIYVTNLDSDHIVSKRTWFYKHNGISMIRYVHRIIERVMLRKMPYSMVLERRRDRLPPNVLIHATMSHYCFLFWGERTHIHFASQADLVIFKLSLLSDTMVE